MWHGIYNVLSFIGTGSLVEPVWEVPLSQIQFQLLIVAPLSIMLTYEESQALFNAKSG